MPNLTYTVLTLGLALFLLTACGTMEGAGRDIEGAGESIQKSAQ